MHSRILIRGHVGFRQQVITCILVHDFCIPCRSQSTFSMSMLVHTDVRPIQVAE